MKERSGDPVAFPRTAHPSVLPSGCSERGNPGEGADDTGKDRERGREGRGRDPAGEGEGDPEGETDTDGDTERHRQERDIWRRERQR